MKSMFLRSYGLASGIALWLSTLPLSGYAEEKAPPANVAQDSGKALQEYSLNHTVNFSNVSVAEVIRFVSKITGYNFIFAAEDVGFNVSIISEEPMSTQNIMTSLVQVLRIHGLKMLEQDENFVITKLGSGANQIPDIVVADSGSSNTKAAIITRIFRVKNTPLYTLVDVLQPMLSNASLIEVVPQTNQLIVTDVTTNVDKIATLLAAIDVPLSNLNIELYTIKHMGSDIIIPLAQKILAPFLGGNPLILVPQKETNTIFIISTPHLIEQTLSVLEDLDVEGKVSVVGHGALETYVYKILHQRPEVLLQDLKTVASQTQNVDPNLVQAIQGANYIASAGTIVFLTDSATWDKLKTLLEGIDTTAAPVSKPTFWMYKVEKGSPDNIKAALKQLSSTVKDPSLQETISSAQWITQSHSFLFTGPESAISRLQEILPTLDITEAHTSFYIYKVKGPSVDELQSAVNDLLPSIQDPDLRNTIETIKPVPDKHALTFSGTKASIESLESILSSLDTTSYSKQIFLYNLQKASHQQILSSIEKMAKTSKDKNLSAAISSAQWIEDSNTLVFHTTPDEISKLQEILPTLDVPKISGHKQIYVYKTQAAIEEKIQSALEQVAKASKDPELIETIRTMQWVPESQTFVFQGSEASLKEVQELLKTIDIKDGKTEPFIYKIQKGSEEQVVSLLKQLAHSSDDKNLIEAVKSMQWIKQNQILIFNGSPEAISKLQALLPQLDSGESSLQTYLYPLRKASQEKMKESLDLLAASSKDPALVQAISTMSWVEESHTYIFQGTPKAIAELEKILPTFDVSRSALTRLYIYQVDPGSVDQLKSALEQISATSDDASFKEMIKTAQWSKASSSMIFQGSDEDLAQLKDVLQTIDLSSSKLEIYVYKIRDGSQEQITNTLQQMSDSLDNKDFSSAVDSMQYLQDSHSLIFHASKAAIAKLKDVLSNLDTATNAQVYVYKTQNPSPAHLAAALHQLEKTTQDKALLDAIKSMHWVAESKSFIFQGSPEAIAKLQSLIPSLDAEGPAPTPQLYMYTLQKASQGQLLSTLEQMAQKSGDPDLIAAVDDVQWIPSSRTLVFNTIPSVITKLQGILPTLDVTSSPVLQMYMYKLQAASKDQMMAALDTISDTTQDKDLAAAINSAKWMDDTNTFIFNGTAAAIAQLQTILPSLDTVSSPTLSAISSKGQFFLYTPKYQSADALQEAITDLIDNLKGSGLQNGNFLTALESMKWVPTSSSLIFTGDSASLERIQTILATLDVPSPNATKTFFYKPVYASETQLQSALMQFAQGLDPSNASDQKLSQAIYQMQWNNDSRSFGFKADADTIARLQTTLASLDSPQGLSSLSSSGFFIYKLQYVPGNTIIANLTNVAAKFPASDPNTAAITKAIQNIKWIEDNNSLMITGSPYIIDQMKNLIGEFDTSAAAPKTSKAELFMYKPINKTPDQLVQSLVELSKDLNAGSFSDPELIQCLQSAKAIPGSQSVLFTAPANVITKVQTLLPAIDTKSSEISPIQLLGETTFLVYKIKQASHEELMHSLQTFASQLGQGNIADQMLIKSLSTVKWISETNSLMFTGPQETLRKVESLAEKFDLSATPPPAPAKETPATFTVYTPKAQRGGDLIGVLNDFVLNLKQAGICDTPLFEVVAHLKYIEKTNSLIISGEPAGIQKVEELLGKFDVPGSEENPQIDASNFLIYKLQYHQGVDIQYALKQVATSLSKSTSQINAPLINAIDSLQWVEVTNSLLGTGDPDTLARIRQLIVNLDVPLRQVFIEVLVIQTSLFNSQNFGLQWGSQFQYLNKTIGAMGNFPTVMNNNINNSSNQPPGTLSLSNPISFTTNTNTPVQGNPSITSTGVPFSTGFDLGVIGDIIFHKGQSFISMGSLLNALQVDNDSTVLMNPKIVTQDGRTSSIFVGQNIPFIGSFVSNSASNTVQSSNIEYRNVGINLVVTPTLGTNNVITLDISQEISQQSPNTTNVQGSQVTGIQTSQTNMNTRVHVPDRHFLVLSGMIQDSKTHFRSSIPCLGGLPVIGALFAENDRADSKSNVIIFLRPFIIDSFKDYDQLTADEEALYKEQAGLQDLKEEFDAGTEMIKDLHND